MDLESTFLVDFRFNNRHNHPNAELWISFIGQSKGDFLISPGIIPKRVTNNNKDRFG